MRWSLKKNEMGPIGVITISYLLINWYITFYNEALWSASFSLGTVPENNFWVNLLVNSLVGILAGLFGGYLLLKVHKTVFRRTSFQLAIGYAFLAFLATFVLVTFATASIFLMLEQKHAFLSPAFLTMAVERMFTPLVLVYFLLWLVIAMFTIFMLQVNDKFGPGILKKFIMGQYHQPRTEDRIFLFLDMKSSTTIAEKIGNQRYFRLLHDVFSDIADSILDYNGEIYQYVGDEVVISWPLTSGLADHNALMCFADIRSRLADLAPYYELTYGVVPTFKAGLHHGSVTAGELGSIKRDIVYSGDVLNTTARIQELCNHFGVDFLVSDHTISLFEQTPWFTAVPLGNRSLMGREETIDLHTVRWLDRHQQEG